MDVDVERLIAKLEAASEGTPELDARIQAIEYGEEFVKLDDGPRGAVNARDHLSVCWIAQSGKRYTCWYTKAYTRSLDAVVTLVPRGAWWSVQHLPNPHTDEARAAASVTIDGAHIFEKAATPALALCIAALKAQASLPETPEAADV